MGYYQQYHQHLAVAPKNTPIAPSTTTKAVDDGQRLVPMPLFILPRGPVPTSTSETINERRKERVKIPRKSVLATIIKERKERERKERERNSRQSVSMTINN